MSAAATLHAAEIALCEQIRDALEEHDSATGICIEIRNVITGETSSARIPVPSHTKNRCAKIAVSLKLDMEVPR